MQEVVPVARAFGEPLDPRLLAQPGEVPAPLPDARVLVEDLLQLRQDRG